MKNLTNKKITTGKETTKTGFDEHAGKLVVKGARTHNLKDITVEMPRNKMVVFTGLSGSGKSSLAFDTIFAEGQRRYVESLSSYARQFLRQMSKPDVDEISGLSPAISIDQKSRSNNPRSTVATITEIYDYLRVLYARIGRPHCLVCNREIKKLSHEEIIETILKTVTTSDVSKSEKKVMGVSTSTEKIKIFSPVVVGRKGEYYQMLYDFLGKGYEWAKVDGKMQRLRERIELDKNKHHTIDILIDEIYVSEFKTKPKDARERLSEACEHAIKASDGLLKVEANKEERLMSVKFMCPYDGYSYPEVEPRLFSFNSPYGACSACNGLGTKNIWSEEPCETCGGKRLREEALHVLINEKNIVDVTSMSIEQAAEFFSDLKLTETEKNISKVVLKEIESRLHFMLDVGIDYLTLDRKAYTLSGGEAQRIRLASQLGSGLVGALYVLDEPTIGLHQRDNDRLIKTLLDLRNLGNTILVVEHDEDTIFASDYIIDIGPGAGVHGGKVVVSGWLDELLTAKTNKSGSLTLEYLRGDKKIEMPDERREQDKGKIMIRGGNIFNIKNLDVDIPLGKFVAVTGVSGSGKSSLLYEILYKNLQSRYERGRKAVEAYNCKSFTGTEYAGRAVLIDQSPIGARREQIPRHIRERGRIFAICSRKLPKPVLAVGSRIVFHSTSKVADAKPAKATEKLPSKCISCPRFTCRAKSVAENDLPRIRSK